MYNLHYVPTTLGVQSWREIISGGTGTKKVEYRCSRPFAVQKRFSSSLCFRTFQKNENDTFWDISQLILVEADTDVSGVRTASINGVMNKPGAKKKTAGNIGIGRTMRILAG
jgi:hypothetical protein